MSLPTVFRPMVLPPIAIHFADGGSGVDLDSLRVWFDVPLGTGQPESGDRPVGADISDSFLRKENGARDASGATDIATASISVEALRILSAQYDAGQFKLSFATATDWAYTIERTGELPSSIWENVAEITGTGGIYEFADLANGLPEDQYYYRIRVR